MRAAIVLAAGRSRRFGARDKLVVRYRGRLLAEHAIRTALRSDCAHVLVVMRTMSPLKRLPLLKNPRISTVEVPPDNASRRQSLTAALRALRPLERAALILLGDMPALDIGQVRKVVRSSPRCDARAIYRGQPGHPVLIRDPLAALARLTDGKPALAADWLRNIPTGRGAIADIDRSPALKPVPIR